MFGILAVFNTRALRFASLPLSRPACCLWTCYRRLVERSLVFFAWGGMKQDTKAGRINSCIINSNKYRTLVMEPLNIHASGDNIAFYRNKNIRRVLYQRAWSQFVFRNAGIFLCRFRTVGMERADIMVGNKFTDSGSGEANITTLIPKTPGRIESNSLNIFQLSAHFYGKRTGRSELYGSNAPTLLGVAT